MSKTLLLILKIICKWRYGLRISLMHKYFYYDLQRCLIVLISKNLILFYMIKYRKIPAKQRHYLLAKTRISTKDQQQSESIHTFSDFKSKKNLEVLKNTNDQNRRKSIERYSSPCARNSFIRNTQIRQSKYQSKKLKSQNAEGSQKIEENLKNYIDNMKGMNTTIRERRKKKVVTKKEQFKWLLGKEIGFDKKNIETIMDQKKTLKNLEEYRFKTEQLTTESLKVQPLKQKQINLKQTFEVLEKVYSYIIELEIIGYPKKANKYVISFCNNYPSLKQILLNKIHLKKSDQDFTVQINLELLKNRIWKMQIMGKVNFLSLYEQFKKLEQFMMDVIVRKKSIQLTNIVTYIKDRIKNNENCSEELSIEKDKFMFTQNNNENLSINNEIQNIEYRYGKMNKISKMNRKRYQQLNQAFQELNLATKETPEQPFLIQ